MYLDNVQYMHDCSFLGVTLSLSGLPDIFISYFDFFQKILIFFPFISTKMNGINSLSVG